MSSPSNITPLKRTQSNEDLLPNAKRVPTPDETNNADKDEQDLMVDETTLETTSTTTQWLETTLATNAESQAQSSSGDVLRGEAEWMAQSSKDEFEKRKVGDLVTHFRSHRLGKILEIDTATGKLYVSFQDGKKEWRWGTAFVGLSAEELEHRIRWNLTEGAGIFSQESSVG
jgi:hypothetical protein